MPGHSLTVPAGSEDSLAKTSTEQVPTLRLAPPLLLIPQLRIIISEYLTCSLISKPPWLLTSWDPHSATTRVFPWEPTMIVSYPEKAAWSEPSFSSQSVMGQLPAPGTSANILSTGPLGIRQQQKQKQVSGRTPGRRLGQCCSARTMGTHTQLHPTVL